MSAPSGLLELVERFDRNADAYRSSAYNETQLRHEFLDPMFELLGWDVNNRKGYAEPYKDVIHEFSLKVGEATKAPDYCFRIGGQPKFYVEAKKPAVNIKDDAIPAFQLRRYAWSSKLPLSILSDFEEFAVYDTRVAPAQSDKASAARTQFIRYSDYPEKWDEITSVFSRDAVLKGSFDRYVETTRSKRGTAEVDDAFLKEIESWRSELARNLALRNHLTQRELNFAVQRTIDRIIFLRICEDRGIERYGQLKDLAQGERLYLQLCALFQKADDRYNSGLFHFQKEAGRAEDPDPLTLKLTVDDKVLRDIFRRLYYPDSPYEFSVLPADILGQVYEQFLGKVIRLTEGGHAKVEDKPEVKKAGGVYYTPTYIVDYIVKNTVGKLLEGKTPKQVSKLRILDPACGSGSFLLGAYQHLLDWHRKWYEETGPDKFKKELYQGARGEWRLTTAEKKRILLNNIYGVDIDSQAVEVTKLSLLLKVLEGESEQTLAAQLKLFHERALPDLGSNIKCGNSLVSSDFYRNEQIRLLSEEERYRINVLDWDKEFKSVCEVGGFDAVIGNPPYGALIGGPELRYLTEHFTATTRDMDTYALFVEKAIRLARSEGRVAMIVPTGWYSGKKFKLLRRFVACSTDPLSFVNLPYDIFAAWVDTTVFVLRKRSAPLSWPRMQKCGVALRTFPKRKRIRSAAEIDSEWHAAELTTWFQHGGDEYLTYADSDATQLIQNLEARCLSLGHYADVQRGVTPFHVTPSPTHKTSRRAFSGTIRRYLYEVGESCYIRFDGTLAEPKPERYFRGPRLLLRELISRQFQLQATFVAEEFVTNKSFQSILPTEGGPGLLFLLGCINSRLLSWYFLKKSNVGQRDDFPKIVLKETRDLPIPKNLTKDSQSQVERLVSSLLECRRMLEAVRTDQERSALQRQFDAADQDLDRLVYQLYQLTPDEVTLVESSGQPVTRARAAEANL